MPKYKYSFNDKTFDLSISTSLDNKIGAYRAKQPALEDKIKSSSSFTLDKLVAKRKTDNILSRTPKHDIKLPSLRKRPIENPEHRGNTGARTSNSYYMGRIAKGVESKESNYLTSLGRQHFLQIVDAIRIGQTIQLPAPAREIKLAKKNPKHKTVCLDLDECLIHCDELSNNYTIKLDFPIEGGLTVAVHSLRHRQASEFDLTARISSES